MSAPCASETCNTYASVVLQVHTNLQTGDREYKRSRREMQFTELLLCMSYFLVVISIVVSNMGTNVTPYFSEFSVGPRRTAVESLS